MTRIAVAILVLLFSGAGCGYAHDSAAFSPPDWRTTYVQVHACMATAHPSGGYVEIWASPDIDAAGRAGEALPAGGVLVKSQWNSDANCTPGAEDVYTLMRKTAEGTAPDVGDWEWQTLGSDGSTLDTSAPGCASCHAGCQGHLCTDF